MSFIKPWLEAVDSILLARAMLTHDLLDNYDFEEAYQNNVSPLVAAVEALFDISIEDLQ